MAERGFTLVELLVVIAIIALLVGLAAPRLTAALPGVRLKSDALNIATSLRAARGEAIAANREAVFVLDNGSRQFYVAGLGERQPFGEAVEVTLVTARRELVDAARGAIRFFPDGSSTGGRITLAEGSREYRIDVNWLTGRVRVLD